MWKDLPDYNHISISDTGEIMNKNTGKILKQTANKAGYLSVSIKPNGKHGKAKCLRIHREVALAFIPNPLNLPQVNHIDGDKSNNTVSNLEWITASGNVQHAYDSGIHSNVRPTLRNLSKTDVEYIKSVYIPNSREYGTRALGRKYGLSHVNIQRILNGESYN